MSAATEAMRKAREAKKAPATFNTREVTQRQPKVSEEDKVYVYQLVQEYPNEWKPVDKKNGKPLYPPYPKHFTLPNEGMAFDEETKRARNWRFIEGQPSIWVDEQPELANVDKDEIHTMLGQEENQFHFEFGTLHVRGVEKMKRQALEIQDCFEGKKKQYRPKLRTFRLVNPEVAVDNAMSHLDKQFNAEKMARELTDEQMIECAYIMGINTDDLSDAGIKKIRLEFLTRSKYDPKNPKALDWFTGIIGSPVTHITYVFRKAIEDGELSVTQIPGKLTWSQAGLAIMDIPGESTAVDYLSSLYIEGDEKVIRLVEELEGKMVS